MFQKKSNVSQPLKNKQINKQKALEFGSGDHGKAVQIFQQLVFIAFLTSKNTSFTHNLGKILVLPIKLHSECLICARHGVTK